MEPLTAALPADEQARAARFKVEPPRWQFIVSRTMLRRLLGAYLDVDPGDVVLAFGPHGKPRVAEPRTITPFHFNLSHAGDALLVGVSSPGEIGVDVEVCRTRSHLFEIAERHFHPNETSLLSAASPEEAVRLFHRFWTLKEAYIKAVGEGLRYPMSALDFSRRSVAGAPGRLDTAEGRWRCAQAWARDDTAVAAVWRDVSGRVARG